MVETVDAREETVAEGAGATGGTAAGPSRVGRYLVLDRIGQGGMGIVYAAYDPELDRKIAIKLIDPARDDGVSRLRLQREAQAMARLQHPNVVAVYDVGTHGERVFVAMEFVRGRTLGEHLKHGDLPWRRILELLVAAGRGLAAAHEVGLVHRDFKPDNVLVSDRGRVQVTDFGLARAGEVDDDEPDEARAPVSPARLRVTRTGALIGTPAYMAPEQHARRPADARADQFAFCVAAYEALYGRRPHQGETVGELAAAVLEGRMQPIPRRTRVPRAVGVAIERGLAADPEARWPDMPTLLDHLERAPGRARLPWLVAGGTVVVALVAARSLAASDTDCPDPAALQAEAWSDTRRGEVEAALRATGVPYADTAWAQLDPLVGGQVAAWADARRQACVAHQRGELSDVLLDRQSACLSLRYREVESLVTVLADADAGAVEKSVTAASQLEPVETCTDTAALLAEVEPPRDAAAAARVAELRAEIDRARLTGEMGKVSAALAIARDVNQAATELGYRPLRAEAHRALGLAETRAGAYEDAQDELQAAWWDALATGHDRVAAQAAADLVIVAGVQRSHLDEGLVWARNAAALLEARGDDPALAARYHAGAGHLYGLRGDHDQAIAQLRQAVDLERRRFGGESPAVARQIAALGLALFRKGDYDAAREHFERARDLQIAVLGASHPDVATTRNNLGRVYQAQGRHVDARGEYEQALEIRIAVLGADHPDTASSHTNLGAVLRRLGDFDAAVEHLHRAVEIKTRALGPDDPQVADALTNLGNVSFAREDYASARQMYARALDIYTRALGSDSAGVAAALNNLGTAQWKLGELDDADANLRKALTIWEHARGPDHPDVAATLLGLGEVALARGRRDDAAGRFEHAVRALEGARHDDELLARVRFGLARALVDRDPSRSASLADEAATTFSSLGETAATELAAVEAFRAAPH